MRIHMYYYKMSLHFSETISFQRLNNSVVSFANVNVKQAHHRILFISIKQFLVFNLMIHYSVTIAFFCCTMCLRNNNSNTRNNKQRFFHSSKIFNIGRKFYMYFIKTTPLKLSLFIHHVFMQ